MGKVVLPARSAQGGQMACRLVIGMRQRWGGDSVFSVALVMR
jgi:hypothetical protein